MTTASSTWAFELGRMADDVLAKLRATLGDATPPALRFAPGPLPSAGPSDEVPVRLELEPSDLEEAASLTAAIEDTELRAAVRSAAAASLARARHDRGV